jgi:branched-chain amino acid transport system permease protein
LPVAVAFAALVGVLVGIPALRLSGLFLAILTIAVALLFDRWLLVAGTWDAFSGGITPWHPGRPTLLGLGLHGAYAFYLFALAWFLLASWFVWNLRTGKTGRVLRAIRDSEVAASTMGLDLTAWKLAAFGVSAGLAGLGGALLAVSINSVSPASYDFQHSLQIAAVATVWGVGSVASPAFGGAFLIYGPEILRHTPISNRWFPAVVGVALVAQLVYTPDGVVVDTQRRIRALMRARGARPPAGGEGGGPPPEAPPPRAARARPSVPEPAGSR